MTAGGVMGDGKHIFARKLDEVGSHRPTLLRHAGDIAGRVLHAGDVAELVESLHRVDRHVDGRATGDVVDDDRDSDRVVDGLEVTVEPLLGRPVVIGRDDQDRVGADRFGVAREGDRVDGRVRARTGHDRHPALRLLDTQLDDALVLLMGQGGALARRPDRNQAVGAALDLPGDEAAELVLVEDPVPERGHERRERAPQAARRRRHRSILPALRRGPWRIAATHRAAVAARQTRR